MTRAGAGFGPGSKRDLVVLESDLQLASDRMSAWYGADVVMKWEIVPDY
jgi:hypothetical protein